MSVLPLRDIYSVPALKQNKGSPETTETAEIRLNVAKSHYLVFSFFALTMSEIHFNSIVCALLSSPLVFIVTSAHFSHILALLKPKLLFIHATTLCLTQCSRPRHFIYLQNTNHMTFIIIVLLTSALLLFCLRLQTHDICNHLYSG